MMAGLIALVPSAIILVAGVLYIVEVFKGIGL